MRTVLFLFLISFGYSNAALGHYQNYLLYDVFQGEGFNLRRDVYIRLANVVRLLNKLQEPTAANWTLVLPPWSPMYHWMAATSQLEGASVPQKRLPWSTFFDMPSLSEVIPVMDLDDFIETVLRRPDGSTEQIDLAIQLFRTPLGESRSQMDAVYFCAEELRSLYRSFPTTSSPPMTLYPHAYRESEHDILNATNYDCLTGNLEPVTVALFLGDLLETIETNNTFTSIYLGSAETIIHGQLSEWSAEYWTVRRSMVFSEELRFLGDEFRRTYLNSTDVPDQTLPPTTLKVRGPGSAWIHKSWPLAPAVGGPYLAVHWRCGDYLQESGDRWANTPSPIQLAEEIKSVLALLRDKRSTPLNVVFLSTDAEKTDIDELLAHLHDLVVLRFEPTLERWNQIGPGGIAIVDQWICSHARFFLGTYSSTFTFRITEERSIMGFPFNTTFNTICPKGVVHLYKEEMEENEPPVGCEALSAWPVVYEPGFTFTDEHRTPRPEL